MKTPYKAVCFAILVLPRFAVTQVSPAPATTASEQRTSSQPPQLLKSDVFWARVRHPLEWRDPEYPKHALQYKLQGSVVLTLTLNRKGRVSKVAVLSGDPELAHAATSAVRKWKYAPSPHDGHSETTVPLTIDFKINDAGAPQVTTRYDDPWSGKALAGNHGITAPRALYSPDPKYTKEARKAKVQGACLLSVIIGADGMPRDVHVVHSNKGLDEKAIEAIQRWRFAPAKKDGVPVAVSINVEVQFRLY